MKVYIQQYEKQFLDDWLFSAFLGFRAKGADIKFFENIDNIPFNNDDVVVAYIEDSIKYFERGGVKIPEPLNIPTQLIRHTGGRQLKITTMGEFKSSAKLPIFVKPQSRVKQFSSGVLEKQDTMKYVFDGVSDDSLVMTSDVVDFLSEYRCFVYKGKLESIKHYKGDIRIFPDTKSIDNMIAAYKSAPIAYSLDVGISYPGGGTWRDLTTTLVECNDMWSIGHYGLDAETYSSMLRDRWLEIVRK